MEILTKEGDGPKGTMEMRNTAHVRAAPPGPGAGDTPKLPRDEMATETCTPGVG